jgi:hypothetical protein
MAGMCRNRTHPTPSEVTTVLKTAPNTSLDALPLNRLHQHWEALFEMQLLQESSQSALGVREGVIHANHELAPSREQAWSVQFGG